MANKYVPNQGNESSPIWIINDMPGEDEEYDGKPLSGRAGELLFDTLGRYGIGIKDCYITGLSHYRAKHFELLDRAQLRDDEQELASSIDKYDPLLLVPLGDNALKFFFPTSSITKLRGSIFERNSGTSKIIPLFHPKYVSNNPSNYPTFAADVKRVAEDSKFRGTNYTNREFWIEPTGFELEQLIEEYETAKILGCDIESVKNSTTILCHGFAISPTKAIVLPHSDYYLPFIHRLYGSLAKKIFHFGMYDSNMLYENSIPLVNYTEDTFLQFHVLEPELPRGLDYLTSIYTREPYYKGEGRGEIPDNIKAWGPKVDKNKLYVYNAKDCCVTFEIWISLQEELKAEPNLIANYRYLIDINQIALEMGRNGLEVDKDIHHKLEVGLGERVDKLIIALSLIAGWDVNVNSPLQIKKLLYTQFGLPVRKKRNAKGTSTITADEDAIVSLIAVVKGKKDEVKTDSAKLGWQLKEEALKLILEIRGIEKIFGSYLNVKLNNQGRACSTYSVGGTDTGRWSAMKYVGDMGFNAMTMPREAVQIPDVLNESFNVQEWLHKLVIDLEDDSSKEDEE